MVSDKPYDYPLRHNSTVGLSGARVSLFHPLVPQLIIILQVYDGFNATAPLFGTFCGDMRANESCVPPKIRSSTNGLYVEFHSNTNVTAGGIRAVFVSAEGIFIC